MLQDRQTDETPFVAEHAWRGRPSLLSEIWVWIGLGLACSLILRGLSTVDGLVTPILAERGLVPPWSQVPFSDDLLLWGLAALLAFWRMLVVLTTNYAVDDERVLLGRGVFNRRLDLLELHRVRDIEVLRPLHLRILGLGNIVLHTVDRTTSTLTLRAQSGADLLGAALYDRAKAEQERIGYREFEGTSHL